MTTRFFSTCLLLWLLATLSSLVIGFQARGVGFQGRTAISEWRRVSPVSVGRAQSDSFRENDNSRDDKNITFGIGTGANRKGLLSSAHKVWLRLWFIFQQQLYRLLGRHRWTELKRWFRTITERHTIYVLECDQGKYYVGSTQNKRKRFHQHLVEGTGSVWTQKYKPIRVLKQYKRVPRAYALGLESKVTAEIMLKYGVNNARGAMFCHLKSYTTRDLDSLTRFLGHYNGLNYRGVREMLRAQLAPHTVHIPTTTRTTSPSLPDTMGRQVSATDVCFNCGQKGHWALNCPYPSNRANAQRGANHNGQQRNGIQSNSTEQMALRLDRQANLEWNVEDFSFPPARQNGFQRKREVNDRCFRCGRRGHWAKNCPF